MMKKFFPLFLAYCLLAVQSANAEDTTWYRSPSHFAVIMPSVIVDYFEEPDDYEGVEFPLFCGIASVYPKENKFVFTKMTNLPIQWVEKRLRQIEKDGYLLLSGHPPQQVSVKSGGFFLGFLSWGNSEWLKVYYISNGQEIPLKVVPRFKRTCRYNSTKKPSTDCAYHDWDITDLYIPFTQEEIEHIKKENAK